MMNDYTEEKYEKMLEELFTRFPSFQKVGSQAYKPGLGNMEFIDSLLGHPHRKYRTIHIAGTNGKGSVANITASVLAAHGMKTGLYTSPHILDFRERIRVVDKDGFRLIDREAVWDFVLKWKDSFDHLGLSFFEITTAMAFDWFAAMNVDIAVIETGLGGRLDSTNIITPVLSIVTNIGLDHCDLLGDTLPEIAFEKSGIFKPLVPAVVGESSEETDSVFRKRILYTNLPEESFMGDKDRIMSLLTFADKTCPELHDMADGMLSGMDLKGSYQKKNLNTVLVSLDVLSANGFPDFSDKGHRDTTVSAIMNAAARCGFRGRWEKIHDNPPVICDIGHNAHGLKYNFGQLERLLSEGSISDLIMVYGSVSDKDVDAVLSIFPEGAHIIFTNASSRRAMSSETLAGKWNGFCRNGDFVTTRSVDEAVRKAIEMAGAFTKPLIYVGGSTYVVAEAVAFFERNS